MTPAENFGQLRLKFTDPVQHHYEVIRPIILFSETISERSRQTVVERTQVGEKAKRFARDIASDPVVSSPVPSPAFVPSATPDHADGGSRQ